MEATVSEIINIENSVNNISHRMFGLGFFFLALFCNYEMLMAGDERIGENKEKDEIEAARRLEGAIQKSEYEMSREDFRDEAVHNRQRILWDALEGKKPKRPPDGPAGGESVEWRLEYFGWSIDATKDQLNTIKQAVMDDDALALARLIYFPLRIWLNDEPIYLRGVDDLVKYYEVTITASVKAAVLCEEFRTLFVNWQGVMIGRGQIWFLPDKQRPIVTINTNVPLEECGRMK